MSGYSDRDQNIREGRVVKGEKWAGDGCVVIVCVCILGKAQGAAEKNCTIWVMNMALGRFILLVRLKEAEMLV